ncbi:MAG TPA: glycosyltransferase family 2 protein [Brevundimonas sp.]|jgi:glycosyltransferase involved in cell wall biosynthesis|uniref:glycosyltransferase family 2 protein n=1 Tax=Brevundimonas sp. TaxID=1871086 RepID=UPI002B92D8E5|nr:glycosyltransferase family 2 protein [Brevundimonas sp.]HRH19344.1 glycosyltransferase family 2 protein [Brevundimonas sp.]
MARVRLSCCIIAFNEADRLARCMEAIRGIADEIVVVDSGSTDGTVDLARSLGARVFHRDWDGYGPQKRFAEDCAAYDWILNLDADEVVTPALAAEIKTLLSITQPPLPAYRITMPTVFPGASRPRLWAESHNYVRLYDRRRVRFRQSLVHDTVDTRHEQVGQLQHIALHYSNRSIEHVRQKLDRYTQLQAKELRKSPLAVWLRLPFEYPLVFFRYYILRRNFTGGSFGFQSSHIAAEMRVKRLLRILEAQRQAGQA